ncbi:TPA: hypothetical protein EYN98_02725 [Candidatus Poribacteria bacterium]|nr:hypothetical protein [Candidatus Poribacteria bacterium]
MRRSILLFSLCLAMVFIFMGINVADAQPPKISKGWLWMVAKTSSPGGSAALASKVDWLAEATGKLETGQKVSEAKVATSGVKAGDKVGDLKWTKGDLAVTGGNNINDLMVKLGFGKGDIQDSVAYGVIELDSPKEQKAQLHTGSDDAVQVWLNGKSVQRVEKDRGAGDYQEQIDVTLKQGKNILMAASYEKGGGWSMFVGVNADFTTSGGDKVSYVKPPPKPGAKILDWLWVIAPTASPGGAAALNSKKDWLAEASGGKVTEKGVASGGAREGNVVGDLKWTFGKIAATGGNNVNDLMVELKLGAGDIQDSVAYAVTHIFGKGGTTTLHTGSDDAIQVWLNGEVVQSVPKDRGAGNYQEKKEVTLKSGDNILMVATYEKGGGWSMFVGFDDGVTYEALAPVEPKDKLVTTWGKLKSF